MPGTRLNTRKSNKNQDKQDYGTRSRSISPEYHDVSQDGGATALAWPDDKTDAILKELREFRRDNRQQLGDIKEELKKTNARMAEAEERITKTEERIQTTEDVTSEMLKLLAQFDASITDQQARSMRENIRVYGVGEGLEDGSTMNDFVEQLLKEGLGLPDEPLHIQRSHRSLGPKPPADAQPRSIVAKFLSFKTKDMVLRVAWQKKGFMWRDQRISLDNDYPARILHKRREYQEARTILRDKKIAFKTLHPARLKVEYVEGTKIYDTAVEATHDMAKRGFPVTVIQAPETLMERIRQLTWQKSTRRRERRPPRPRPKPSYKEKLQTFRRVTTPPPREPLGGEVEDGELESGDQVDGGQVDDGERTVGGERVNDVEDNGGE